MKRIRSWLARVGFLSAGVVLIGLGICFPLIGLDDADKLASVLGAFIGVSGLVLSAYGIVLAHRAQAAGRLAQAGSPPSGRGAVRNVVSGSVHGTLFQGGEFAGPITIDSSAIVAPPPPPTKSRDHAAPRPER